ncbi:pheromone A receptor-domain-containing protein [Hygrophoropsis aurantiaca]|uniref:Pheromone A receptor-domain-containing protein n=1 Tax=Hygrophoropsis aurantiaca TaxID=72124 RepID=A0ACB8AHE8_9AGAM|nr:pheromone A receptor-domain-containing protein [Hygrophoropsis aurantiaca]
MVPSNLTFSTFAFIGFVLVSIPLPWCLQSWNIGTCMYIAWTSLGCLIQFVNSILWNNNVINRAPIWCDISARYIVGSSVGIPASSLCIIRRLYRIALMQSVDQTKRERRWDVIIDLSIGIGFPIVIMALEYIVQGHRFDIYEEIGCYPATYNTPPSYPLVLMWPVVIGLISAVYAGLTFRVAFKRKTRLQEILRTNSQISTSRYWRLMVLSGIEIMCTVPLGLYAIVLNSAGHQVQPWLGWADVHYDFSRVGQIPSVIWKGNLHAIVGLETTRWLYVLCAFTFFGFFGLAEEARTGYRRAVYSAAQRLGCLKRAPADNMTKNCPDIAYAEKPELPLYASKSDAFNDHFLRIRPQSPPVYWPAVSSLRRLPRDDFPFLPYDTTLPEYSSASSLWRMTLPSYRTRDDAITVSLPPPTLPEPVFRLPPIPHHRSMSSLTVFRGLLLP